MFRALDRIITDRLDRLTLRLQKRGLNLAQTHAHAAGACLLLFIGVYITPKVSVALLLFNGVVWGSLFIVASIRANADKDYREDWRKASRLNTEVLFFRENANLFLLRMLSIYLLVATLVFIFLELMAGEIRVAQMIFRAASQLAFTLSFYLKTCVYLVGLPMSKEVPAGQLEGSAP